MIHSFTHTHTQRRMSTDNIKGFLPKCAVGGDIYLAGGVKVMQIHLGGVFR